MREKRTQEILELLQFYGDAFSHMFVTDVKGVAEIGVSIISSILNYQVAVILIEGDEKEPELLASKGILDMDILVLDIISSLVIGAIASCKARTNLFDANKELQREITKRKHMEEKLREREKKYRTLFENSRDAIFIATREGKIVDLNQAGLDLFGYTREEMIGMDGRERVVNLVDRYRPGQIIEQEGSVRDYEIKFLKKDGTEMDCLMTSTVWRDNNGRITGYQGIIRDITEKRKREEEEVLKVEKLESICTLAGGIAHDFNNLLTAVWGNISLAKGYANVKEHILERLVEAEKSVLRTRDLIQQLLTFSRGGMPIIKTTSIASIIKDSASFYVRGTDVACEFSIPDDLWLVDADEGQMRQVITNLIINATEAMPEGGVIKVSAENITVAKDQALPLKEGIYVKISIKDNGSGITKENLQKIFDPYFTTKEIATQKGTGLGLATTYSIIKNHGGYITVSSESGVGTVFHIYLPAANLRSLPTKDVDQRLIAGKEKDSGDG